jgi:hypothetical protein
MRSGRGGIPMMDLGPTAWGLDFAPTRRARTENPASTQWMEARGIEPRSRDVSMRASTCIVRSFFAPRSISPQRPWKDTMLHWHIRQKSRFVTRSLESASLLKLRRATEHRRFYGRREPISRLPFEVAVWQLNYPGFYEATGNLGTQPTCQPVRSNPIRPRRVGTAERFIPSINRVYPQRPPKPRSNPENGHR